MAVNSSSVAVTFIEASSKIDVRPKFILIFLLIYCFSTLTKLTHNILGLNKTNVTIKILKEEKEIAINLCLANQRIAKLIKSELIAYYEKIAKS